MIRFFAMQTLTISLMLTLSTSLSAEIPTATVGARGSVKDVIIPGSELIAKPLEGDPAMIVQVVNAIPHGDSFRYELMFSGLEPGDYDLTEWMQRKDGTELGSIEPVTVRIESLLPPGQVVPNELESGWIPQLGGYRNVVAAAVTAWTVVLLLLIFGWRKKPADTADNTVKPRSLADLLNERLQAGFDNEVQPQQYAELERMLFAFWRRKLSLETLTPEAALTKIKQDKDAGPLMIQLEQWLHRPDSSKDVDLAALLEPYRNLKASDFEAVRSEAKS
jgi:hypothetical protein